MKTVLIIDDDADDIKFLCTAIKYIDPSIKCINSDNGLHALEMLTDGKLLQPDYIFLDLNMPRMGGKECMHKIRNIKRLEAVPVILYTTSKLKEFVAELTNMQAVYFITKPTKISVLKGYILNIFEGKWELLSA